jgi:hypothetical protein
MFRGFTRITSNTVASRIALSIIVLFFLVKGTYLALAVPLFDTADEMFHFDYAYKIYRNEGPPHIFDDGIEEEVFLAAKEAGHWVKEGYATPQELGVLTSELLDSVTWWYKWDISGGHSYEGVQPPLYYLLAAGALLIVPADKVHDQVVTVRMVSVLLGVLLIILTYSLGYTLSGNRFVGICAAAFVAALPAETMIGMRVSNDIAGQVGVTALGAFLAWRTLLQPRGKFDIVTLVGTGALLGLAGLAKANALPAGIIICVIFAVTGRGSFFPRIVSVISVIGLGFLICGWWYLRNYSMYGDAIGGEALVRAIYVEMPWVADTLWEALSYHVDLVRELAFQPYLQFLPKNWYWIPKTLWFLALSVIVLRLIEGTVVLLWTSISRYLLSIPTRRFVRSVHLLRVMFIEKLPVSAIWIVVFVVFSLLLSKWVLEHHEVIVLGAGIIFLTSRLQSLSKPIGKLELVCVMGLLPAVVSAVYFTMQIGPSSERYLLNGVALLAVLWAFSVHQIVREKYQVPLVLLTTIGFVVLDWGHKMNMLDMLNYRLGN